MRSLDKGHNRSVRIFTPSTEVPFAGHPNIGTAFVLAASAELGEGTLPQSIVFEEEVGLVPIGIQLDADRPPLFERKAPLLLPLGKMTSTVPPFAAVALTADDIDITSHEPCEASVGFPLLFAKERNGSVLSRARVNMKRFDHLLADGIAPFALLYACTRGKCEIKACMFAPLDGVPEDPATGSANCALAALLSHYRKEFGGEFR